MPQNWDARRVKTAADRCPECGGKVAGGRGGCQECFDEMAFMMGDDLRIASVHRLALDAYCMQHVESYCASAKSYAAHLVGLSWGIDHLDDPAPAAPVLRVLNQSAPLIKPPVLADRGSITFPDLMAVYHASGDVDDLVSRIRAWARIVWDAYASQHEIARKWRNA